MKYKHYSFDLWLTLIKSNPQFKIERAKYFHKHLNWKNKSLVEVSEIFRNVDLMSNSINEKTGGNIKTEELHLMVISMINDFDITLLSEIDLEGIYDDVEKILFNYLPQLYSDTTLKTLYRIHSSNNCSMNVASNTAFIKGKSLRIVLAELGIDVFSFQTYSDEIGYSKPSPYFFKSVFKSICELKKDEDVELHQIIHIGDNPLADIRGAESFGIKGMLINSNCQTILNIN